MSDTLPSLSTDQVATLVELSRAGSLRAAAAGLHITEQGVRNRLVALEAQLKVSLYHKQRGPRLSSRTERDIEDALLRDPDIAFGLAAPYDGGSGLEFRHLFSLDWGLITPP